MDFIELKLIEKLAKVLQNAYENNNCDRYTLIEKWLSSDTFANAIAFDVSLVSQARSYILRTFESEIEIEQFVSGEEDKEFYTDAVFWFGYITAYWCLMDEISGVDILKEYNINKILDEFDVLHTLKVKTAISMMKEDDKK